MFPSPGFVLVGNNKYWNGSLYAHRRADGWMSGETYICTLQFRASLAVRPEQVARPFFFFFPDKHLFTQTFHEASVREGGESKSGTITKRPILKCTNTMPSSSDFLGFWGKQTG